MLKITHIINDRGMQGQCKGCICCKTGGPGGWVCVAAPVVQQEKGCLGKRYHYNEWGVQDSKNK